MRALTTVAGVAIGALLLSGCLPQQPTATPPPEATAAPIFASDEEALAAATAAYAAYLAMSDQILKDGGKDPDRIDGLIIGIDLVASEKAGFMDFLKSGYRSIGDTKFENIRIQQVNYYSRHGLDVVRVYLCSDVTDVTVVDQSGLSIVSPSRADRTGFEIGFDLADSAGIPLIVSSKQTWNSEEICE